MTPRARCPRYLSYGGGVNSTALMLWLLDQGLDFEAVYADHGADWPETREYVSRLRERGYPITVLNTRRDGLSLYDYYARYNMIPVRFMRHCTEHFKVRPLLAYQQNPCVVYLGIDAGEGHRAKPSRAEGIEHAYPLVDEGINRKGCEQIIIAHGLPMPRKSGCFICPYQRRSQWVELRTVHPELYCKAKRLEDNMNAARAVKGKTPIYMAGDKALDVVCQADQADLWGEREMSPCLCEL